MNYQNTHVRYERAGDKVTPLRITKQWVNPSNPKPGRQTKVPPGVVAEGTARLFMAVRATVTGFGSVNHGPEEWTSTKAAPLGRKELMEQGLIRRPSYESLPCLELDDPATWKKAVVDKGPPWADEYENPYGKGTNGG